MPDDGRADRPHRIEVFALITPAPSPQLPTHGHAAATSPTLPWRLAGAVLITLGVAVVAAVALPVVTLLFGASLTVPRYITGLPMAACVGVNLSVVIAVSWRLLRAVGDAHTTAPTRWEAVTAGLRRYLGAGVLWAMCAALIAEWLFRLLWVPETHGFVTVGGGDAGHHMAIANQLVSHNPKVYVGQTGAHAAAWLLGQLFHLNVPDAMAWAWMGAMAAFYAVVLASVAFAVRDLRAAAQVVAIPLAAGLMVAGTESYVPMIMHYYQAEGFFGHIFSLAPLAAVILCACSLDRWWLRLAGVVVAVGLVRFTYALNAGEALVGLALLSWAAATTRGLRWWLRPLLVLAGVAACAAAGYSWVKLWDLRKMTGGLMDHDVTTETVVLGTLTTVSAVIALSAAIAARLTHTPAFYRVARGALLTAVLGLGPWLVHHYWDQHLELPRAYYYRKHATLALLTLATFIPAWTATLFAFAVHRRRALGLAVVAIAALYFTDVVIAKQAVAGKRIAWSYRERIDPKVRWRVLTPMWEPRTMARIRQVLTDHNRQFGGYQHPSWPVHSVMNSGFERWTAAAKLSVVDVKELRWREWIHGLPTRPGHCVFFTAARAELMAFSQHDRRMKGQTLRHVQGLLRRPDVRCERWRSPRKEQPTQRLCWVCD